MTTNTYLPTHELEAFKKFVAKMQKRVPELKVEYSEPYKKIFTHAVKIDGHYSVEKYQHEIVDLTVYEPEVKDWRLLATYEDGMLFVADMSKKLKFKNPNHGADYGKCDVCGHPTWKKSHIILNTKTGEELQVGGECIRKFGLANIDWIGRFNQELWRLWDIYGCGDDEVCHGSWGSNAYKVQAFETEDIIKAAMKEYQDSEGRWSKGKYIGNIYYASESNGKIQENMLLKKFATVSDYYIAELKKFIKSEVLPKAAPEYYYNGDEYGENFEKKVSDAILGAYITLTDAWVAFFAIKMFEDHKKAKKLPQYEIGVQVKLHAEVVKVDTFEDYYGTSYRYTMKASNGVTFIRRGKVNTTKVGDKEFADVYAIIEYKNDKGYYLSRTTKNPKKGYNTIEVA